MLQTKKFAKVAFANTAEGKKAVKSCRRAEERPKTSLIAGEMHAKTG